MPPILRDYQLDCVERAAQAARDGAKAICIQAACGAGKTTIASEIIRRAVEKKKRVLEIVHRRRLVDQFSGRLKDFDIDHGVIMRGRPQEKHTYVQVASKDTLMAIEGGFSNMPPADLLIVDEGRHCLAGESYKELVQYYRDKGAYIILLDATPALSDGRGLGPWIQELIIASKTSELIKAGYLLPAKVFLPDREKSRCGKMRRGIAGHLVESWQKFAEGLPTVAFFSRVSHSLDAVAAFRAEGISAIHVDASTPDDIRDQYFDDVEAGKYQVLCNVGIVAEGTDLPCLGCAQFFMDPSSRTGFLQRAGRILRPHPGQKYGVIIDHAAACYRHGFPDEDTPWTLEGNVDRDFAEKHKKGMTEKALYCGFCQMAYHGSEKCPGCGRMPAPPPKSVFAPPPVETTSELLIEADRSLGGGEYSRQSMQTHWIRCLAVAKKRLGSFAMASMIYRKKYNKFPDDDFPCLPPRIDGRNRFWQAKVHEIYPDFGKRKRSR